MTSDIKTSTRYKINTSLGEQYLPERFDLNTAKHYLKDAFANCGEMEIIEEKYQLISSKSIIFNTNHY